MPFTEAEQQAIIAAIRRAETATSGEIRVHVEPTCPGADPVARAIAVFADLGMQQTREQNGVLFYVAAQDRKFAVIGDRGIDARVPAGFWNGIKDRLRAQLVAGQMVAGLCEGIDAAGQQLQQFFPHTDADTNELPDDISFG
jgi:uncharacterized membrane protein